MSLVKYLEQMWIEQVRFVVSLDSGIYEDFNWLVKSCKKQDRFNVYCDIWNEDNTVYRFFLLAYYITGCR